MSEWNWILFGVGMAAGYVLVTAGVYIGRMRSRRTIARLRSELHFAKQEIDEMAAALDALERERDGR